MRFVAKLSYSPLQAKWPSRSELSCSGPNGGRPRFFNSSSRKKELGFTLTNTRRLFAARFMGQSSGIIDCTFANIFSCLRAKQNAVAASLVRSSAADIPSNSVPSKEIWTPSKGKESVKVPMFCDDQPARIKVELKRLLKSLGSSFCSVSNRTGMSENLLIALATGSSLKSRGAIASSKPAVNFPSSVVCIFAFFALSVAEFNSIVCWASIRGSIASSPANPITSTRKPTLSTSLPVCFVTGADCRAVRRWLPGARGLATAGW
jgi:hypothetical protein